MAYAMPMPNATKDRKKLIPILFLIANMIVCVESRKKIKILFDSGTLNMMIHH